MSRKWIILAFLTAAVSAAAMPLSANATHLSDVKGAVLVNNQPISASVEVVQGDRVKVVKGSATLVYSNGAAVPISSGQTLVVLASPPDHMSMKDSGWQPQDSHEGEWVVGGAVGLAVVLSQLPKPASP
jgi:hypothetical protein